MSRNWLTYLCVLVAVLAAGAGIAAVSVVIHNKNVRAAREAQFEHYWRSYLATAVLDAPFTALQLKAGVHYDVDVYNVGGWLVEQAAADSRELDWASCPAPFEGGERFGPAQAPAVYTDFRKGNAKLAKALVGAKQAIKEEFVVSQGEPFENYCARLDSEGREPLNREKDKMLRFAELADALTSIPEIAKR